MNPIAGPRTRSRSSGATALPSRTVDAEIDEERALYKLQVRIPPPHNVHPAIAELTGLPEVSRDFLMGLREHA